VFRKCDSAHNNPTNFRALPMELIEEFFYRVKASDPLKTTKGSPDGERNYWIVSQAEIDGPRIKARKTSRAIREAIVRSDASSCRAPGSKTMPFLCLCTERHRRRRHHRRDRETSRAVAKAAEFVEGGNPDAIIKDLLGNVLDHARRPIELTAQSGRSPKQAALRCRRF
jgi:hypothetical protein